MTQQTLPGVALVTVRYSSNNSGGSWWLSDDAWLALQNAGWRVAWVADDPYYKGAKRFLGALATEASKAFASEADAIDEWERVTGECATDAGCSCCGRPHSFWVED